jgi:DNA-nicking Smr family endonuclease
MPAKSPPPDGSALWQRVIETVKPLKGRKAAVTGPRHCEERRDAAAQPRSARGSGSLGSARDDEKKMAARARQSLPNTLDASWDRKLARGLVAPDLTIDLHGYTLSAAHAELEAGLTRAVSARARLILLITGRPPPPERSRLDNPLRGVIRASVGDWLHHSRYAAQIAAIRNAHPKHGGAGALYVILRRIKG